MHTGHSGTHIPSWQYCVVSHSTPAHGSATQLPPTHSWPVAQPAVRHDSSVQAPPTQRKPLGQLTPAHGSPQVALPSLATTQLAPAGHLAHALATHNGGDCERSQT
jgi:hypothetical protein